MTQYNCKWDAKCLKAQYINVANKKHLSTLAIWKSYMAPIYIAYKLCLPSVTVISFENSGIRLYK